MNRALASGQRVPAGGQRSKPSPRFFAVGDTRSHGAAGRGAGVKSGGPCFPQPVVVGSERDPNMLGSGR